MRIVLTVAAGIALALVSAKAARAQDKPKGERPKLDASFFDRLDVNKDGVITLDEIPEERRERVKKLIERLDKNGDGKVTREEFQAGAEALRAQAGRPEGRKPRPDGEKPRPDGERPKPAGGQPRPDGEKPRPAVPDGPPFGPPILGLFRLLDTDGDGKLSRDELAKAVDVLMKFDRNGDGFLTPEEILEGLRTAAGPLPPPGGPGAELIKRFDKNGDGKLSKDEMPERMRERFEEIDTNKDGFVDAQELSQALEIFRKAQRFSPAGERRPDGTAAGAPGKIRGEAEVRANRERIATFLREHDKDADGRISQKEFPGSAEEFNKLDTNGDGYLTPDELARGLAGKGDGSGDKSPTGRKGGATKEKQPEGKGDVKPEKKPQE